MGFQKPTGRYILEEAELAAGSGPVAGGSYGRRRPGL